MLVKGYSCTNVRYASTLIYLLKDYLIENIMIDCKFCQTSCKNLAGLMRHNRLAHDISTEEFRKTCTELYPKKEITEDMIQCKVCLEHLLLLGMPNHLKRLLHINVAVFLFILFTSSLYFIMKSYLYIIRKT